MDSPRRGADHVNLAKSLTEALPNTLGLLEQGKLSERRAAIVSKETKHLSMADRRNADYELSRKLTGLGDRSVRDTARVTADRIDPDGAERRTRAALKSSFAAVYAEPDGTAKLLARLPFDKAVAVHRALRVAAHAVKKDKGEVRSIGEIMAATLVDRVLGEPGAKVNIEIGLVMNERTLLRGSDEPAYVPGYGPITGLLSRQLVLEADKVWIRRLFTAPGTGELVAMESKRRTFTPGLRKVVVARDRTCRSPFCNAEIKHIDHRRPHARKGRTASRNGDGLCERCNYVKTEANLNADIVYASGQRRLRLVTETGHVYESTAPDLPGEGGETLAEVLRRLIDNRRPFTINNDDNHETG